MQQAGTPATSRKVRIERERRSYLVDLTAHPYKDDETENEYVLVILEEREVDPQWTAR